MVRQNLPDGMAERLFLWQEHVERWAHGDINPFWHPPESFSMPKKIGDSGIPKPGPRFKPPGQPPVDAYGAYIAQQAGPPPPPEWAGQDTRTPGGKTHLQLLRERNQYSEDSER